MRELKENIASTFTQYSFGCSYETKEWKEVMSGPAVMFKIIGFDQELCPINIVRKSVSDTITSWKGRDVSMDPFRGIKDA